MMLLQLISKNLESGGGGGDGGGTKEQLVVVISFRVHIAHHLSKPALVLLSHFLDGPAADARQDRVERLEVVVVRRELAMPPAHDVLQCIPRQQPTFEGDERKKRARTSRKSSNFCRQHSQ